MGKVYDHYQTNQFIGGVNPEIKKALNVKGGTFNEPKSTEKKPSSSKSDKSKKK